MLFNSYAFLFVFLPVTLAGYFLLGKYARWAAHWLAIASMAFYAYWNPHALVLLLGSVAANYALSGGLIDEAVAKKRKHRILILSIALNLFVLGLFKYANFASTNLNYLALKLGGSELPILDIVLPLGISFFTFTQIAYLVDCYEGKVHRRNFLNYLLFVTYFPHLIAGPVLHHQQLMPQFDRKENYRPDFANLANGILLFACGLVKKTLLADQFAVYADAIFGAAAKPDPLTSYEAWAGALAYTLQIYFDFSGYSDMALGISRLFNVSIPINFYSPYKATSIIEFWRRWHISLSNFLRDYLYIPLGGNRKGTARRYLNVMATMLLGGLWHGASWTFVVWGALHGLYLLVNHAWRSLGWGKRSSHARPQSLPVSIGYGLLTFACVVLAFVVFRAANMSDAVSMLQAMLGIRARAIQFEDVLHGGLFHAVDLSGRDYMQLLTVGLVWVWCLPASANLRYINRGTGLALLQAGLAVAGVIMAVDRIGTYSPFLYFQF
jgi:alginate O-acetyltransferase complex protein AlgI